MRRHDIAGWSSRRVAGLLALIALASPQPALALDEFTCETGVPAASIALFDGHDHLRVASVVEAQGDLAILAGFGVSVGMLALGTPDPAELSIALTLQSSPGAALFAYVNPPHVTGASGEKTFGAATLAFVLNQLDNHGASGIGEMILRHSGPLALAADIPADQSVAMTLYAEAGLRGVPVSFHFETRDKSAPDVDIPSRVEELRTALSANPDTVFIWSHLGDTGPALVRTLLDEFPNLYGDISSRNPSFERDWPLEQQSLGTGTEGTGSLDPDWKLLFEDHSDRFLFGLDLANDDRQAQASDVIDFYRSVLGELSADTAEKIACGNAQVLLVVPAVPASGTPWVGGGVLMALAVWVVRARRG